MTVREIQGHLEEEETYGTEVSPTLFSSVTDAAVDEVKTWQSRPLEGLYPRNRPRVIPFFDYQPEIRKAIYAAQRD